MIRDKFPLLIVSYLSFQFLALKLRRQTNVPTYLLIESLQLYSTIALNHFNYLPYMFDFFQAL